MIWLRIALSLCLLLLSTGPSAWAQDGQTGERKARPKARGQTGLARNEQIFRAIYPTAPRSLDPHADPDPAAWPIIMASYHRLMTFHQGTAKPEPALAKAVRISPDGLKYTFQLTEGLTFSDGLAVNSEAAHYSFDRLMSSQVGRLYYPHLYGFEILGPYSFTLTLNRPWPPFLASLALPPASLISPGLKNKPPDYLQDHTLGSGSYTVYDWKEGTIGLQLRPDQTARYPVAFAMYHYEADARRRYEKMAAHDAHLTVDPAPPPAGLPARFQRKEAPNFTVRYLAFNTRRPYTRLRNTRRALALVVAGAFKDRPGPLDGFFPPGLFYNAPPRPPRAEPAGSDPLTRGPDILREAGPPAGPLTLAVKGWGRGLADDARLIADTLAAQGLSVNIVTLDGAQGRLTLESGDYDLLLDTRSPDIPSADMWLGRFLDSTSSADGNPAFFQAPGADQLIGEIVNTVGRSGDGPRDIIRLESERAAKLAQLAEIARAEVPYVFLYQVERPLVVDVRLMGLNPHPVWPEVWPIDQTNLRPFSLRSGANPTGRLPESPQAPAESRASSPAAPAAPVPPAGPRNQPESHDLDFLDQIQPGPRNPEPDYDDFIGVELE
ncbi:MAG: ABC transporter substrate-binding protein [Candidatus Adiutrix sp.]|jgi:peptide/nickel transport system substrate-binding protein|nr:ABC transporter substrate-binding protein [Candidatus Adiutrix sp.]